MQQLQGQSGAAAPSSVPGASSAPGAAAEPQRRLADPLLLAARLVSEGVAFDPQSVRLRTSLGYALSAAGRRAEAIEQFRAALRLQPGAGEAREALDEALKASR